MTADEEHDPWIPLVLRLLLVCFAFWAGCLVGDARAKVDRDGFEAGRIAGWRDCVREAKR